MARKVESMPLGKVPRYPDEWFDGSVWELVPGEDSRARTCAALERNVRQAARGRGVTLECVTHEGRLYIQAKAGGR